MSKLVIILLDFGFNQSMYDPCILTYHYGEDVIIVACHVDDLLIISSDLIIRNLLIDHIQEFFKVKGFTENIVYLGLEIIRDREKKTIGLKQTAYVDKLLEVYLRDMNVMSKYPTSTIVTEEGEETFKPIHDVIGKLRYLVDLTRPDLLFPLSLLSRFMANPTKQVMEELLRLIRYVNHPKSNHLTVGGDNCIQLEAVLSCDAAYVQNGDCITQLGYAIYLSKAGGAVYCRSMRASTVTLSSTQAEVDGLGELTKEIIWFQGFLKPINIVIVKPTIVHVDNMPTVTLAAEGTILSESHSSNKLSKME
jgi:hypothetical protein